MKILRVIASMKPENGGPCQGLRNMIPALNEIGVYNEVVCFDETDASYLGTDPFPVHPLGLPKGPYAYSKELDGWLQENMSRFDAVVIHGLWLYNSYGTYRAWKKFKKANIKYPKLYVMPHGMLDPYFQKAKERRVKALRNKVFYSLLEKRVINNSNGILFTCQQELILAREPFKPYEPKAELNVGYGIQPAMPRVSDMDDAFYEQCSSLSRNVPYLLFLSRVHHKKGVDLLIAAYRKLQVKFDMPHLVIAGPGIDDTAYGQELKSMAAGLDTIHFAGMVKGNQKWGAFYNCEAFILPSHQENFGIAVVEAMACSKAVLITDKVNIWREIKEGNAGFVENDDLNGTIKLLEQWTALSTKEKKEMGQDAYKVYDTFFSVKHAALRLKTILEKQNDQ